MNDGISPTPASREQAEQQDSSHFAANGDEAKSLQPLLDALRRDIMNLPRKALYAFQDASYNTGYMDGHRDARHAAADLVAAFASSGTAAST